MGNFDGAGDAGEEGGGVDGIGGEVDGPGRSWRRNGVVGGCRGVGSASLREVGGGDDDNDDVEDYRCAGEGAVAVESSNLCEETSAEGMKVSLS